MPEKSEDLERLLHGLKNKDKEIRWSSAVALVKLGSPVVDRLLPLLDDPQSATRLLAAWALGHIGDKRALKPLISALGDGDWSVRMRAADALGELKDRSAIEHLVALLSDENSTVRRHTVTALSRIGDPSIAPELTPVLRDPDWRVRMAGIMAYSLLGCEIPEDLKPLVLNDENGEVRKMASSVLAH